MMRYQRVSPDCLPLTNGGKKPYLRPSPSRPSNEDTTTTITTTTSLAGRGFHGGSCTTTTSSLDGVPKGFRFRSTQQQDPTPTRGGDVLLQWGQRKRSRNSRAEIRSSTTADDSSSSSGHGKIQSNKVLRRSVNPSMPPPPPPPPVFSSRSTNPRNGFVGGKELYLSRNLEDRSSNGSPSRNMNSRMVSRSAGSKRSPPSPDQIEKRSSVRDHHQNQRQNGSDHNHNQQHQRVNRSESTAQAHPELETNNNNGEREKATQVEVVEWPRIYIALSRKEKEEDFLVMKGTKLPHRPRKRAKNIDKSLQYCFPGLWLSDLPKNRYEVREKKNVKKQQKRRGLKGRRVRRFRMRFGSNRLAGGGDNYDDTILPLRNGGNTENEASCCYCDLKISMFNEPIFRLGRRFSGVMKIWFSVGLGFGVASLLLITLFLLLQFHPKPLSNRLASAVFGFSPSTRVSLSGIVHVFVSTVITVSVHELGHALAAASEGIQMEYVAVFIAAIFPGGLVAFDHDLLQSLPSFNALRVYCAGIWHNAVLCALCSFALFLLPVMLSPFYKHGENLVVVDVPSKSPLFGYLSPGDAIVSLDGILVHKPSEWLELAAILDKQNSETSNGSLNLGGSRRFHHGKGYCAPISLIEEGMKGKMVENRYVCPGDLTPFLTMPCSDAAAPKEVSVCLDAKDIVKLSKCGDGWVTTSGTDIKSDCVCSQGELCLQAVQSPGVSWTEITYKRTSSQDCLDYNTSSCVGTFVFVGDLIAMSRSVQLTSYQPRWLINFFGKSFPDIIERSLTCTFHVSLALVLLNSLPVYYLDGESILESSIEYFTRLSPRKKKKALQVCLFGGSLLSLLAFFRIFLVGLPLSR